MGIIARTRFWILGAVLVALNAAGLVWIHHDLVRVPKARLRILSVLPAARGNVDDTDRFALLFDEPLATPAMLNTALTRAPFQINPTPPGHWQWAALDRLEYRLDQPLPPGRRFTIRPAPDQEMQTGRSVVGESEFQFKTKALQMIGCTVRHVDPSNVDLEFQFNQPVHPQELADRLTLRDTKTSAFLKAAPLMHQPGEKLMIRTSRPEGDLSVRVGSTLTGYGAQLDLGDERTTELHVQPRFSLVRAQVDNPGTQTNVVVNLEFTAELDHAQTLPPITLTPQVADLVVTRGSRDTVRLAGPFECGRRYKAEVSPLLRSASGEALAEKQSTYFDVPQREAALSFVERDGILSPHGNMNLDVQAVNIDGLNVTAARLHANNLVHFLRRQREREFTDNAREFPAKTIKLNMPANEPRTVTLDLASLLGKVGSQPSQSSSLLGVYRVSIEATNHNWTDDAAVVAVTDLGLTTKRSRDGILVWVTSLRTAKPVEGARISALSRNNQTLATAVTDPEGIATLCVPASHPDGPVWLITAELGNDLSYLKPDERPWAVGETDQSGCRAPQTYDVMLYTERGIYRPGETVHLTGIVRDAVGQIPPPFPMVITVTRPDGRRLADIPVTMPDNREAGEGGQGVVHAEFATDPDGPAGIYTCDAILPGSGSPGSPGGAALEDSASLGQAEALVESFVPVRMEVKAQPTKARYGPTDDIELNVSGQYLFGQPGAGLPVVVSGGFKRIPFQSKQYPGFVFEPPCQGEQGQEGSGAAPESNRADLPGLQPLGTLDEHGKATIKITPEFRDRKGLWSGWLATSVTEPGGRSVSANTTVSIDTAGRYLGLRSGGSSGGQGGPRGGPSQIVRPNQPAVMEWVQLLPDDRLAEPGPIDYQLFRVEYDWTIEEVDIDRPHRHRHGARERVVSIEGLSSTQRVWRTVERLTAIQSGHCNGGATSRPDRAAGTCKSQTANCKLQNGDCELSNDIGAKCWKPAIVSIGNFHFSFFIFHFPFFGPAPGGESAVTSKGSFEVRCPTPGSYRLVALDRRSGASTVLNFAAAEGTDDSPGNSVNRPEQVDITLDRADYLPGCSARVLVRSPFAGQMLLTIETDRIIEQRVVELTSKTAVLELPISPVLRGGAFVVATVVRAIDPQAEKWLPHRATGLARLKINLGQSGGLSHRMDVVIDSPGKVAPGQKVHVQVKTASPLSPDRPGVVHLWAVDDGILLTTSYAAPDPIKHFFAPRRLEVRSSDAYSDLLPDYKRPADVTRIGGDGGDDDRRGGSRIRRNPVAQPVRRPAVIWRTAAPVGPDGSLAVDLDLSSMPEMTGRLRLMAVAVDYDRYGVAERPLIVASPLLVESSWPRAAAPGDSFHVPVKLFNTTTQPVAATVRLAVTGPVKLNEQNSQITQTWLRINTSAQLGPKGCGTAAPGCDSPAGGGRDRPEGGPIHTRGGCATFNLGFSIESVKSAESVGEGASQATYVSKALPIDPGKTVTVWFDAVATGVGPVSVAILAEAADNLGGTLTARAGAAFTVRPAAPVHSTARLMTIPASQPGDPPFVLLPDPQFIPGSTRMTVSISGRPNVQLRPVIEQLIGYPYGCVEQTTSKLYAMLHAPGLLPADDVRVGQVRSMIQAGIMRLWSMQTQSGGLGYWPGSAEPNTWGTTYAAGFLVQARKAGYELDKRFTDELVGYLAGLLKPERGQTPLDNNTTATVCYLLAAFGQPQDSWLNQLGDHLDDLDIAGRAYLAAGWVESGRKDLAIRVLRKDTMDQVIAATTGGRITSQTSQYAVLLNVLLDIDPEHPWVAALVGRLEKARTRQGGWGNTHENASCLAALARYQGLVTASAGSTNGGTGGQPRFSGTATARGCPTGGATTAPADSPPGRCKKFDQDHPICLTSDGSIEIESAGDASFPADSTDSILNPNLRNLRNLRGPPPRGRQGQPSIFLSVVTEGLLKQGVEEAYDRQLEVRRYWTDRQGKPIDPTKLKVGDVVQVEVTCRTVGVLSSAGRGGSVSNVAIVDALPGGLEVENPKLTTSAREGGGVEVGRPMDVPPSAYTPRVAADRTEFLDDRVIVFTSADASMRVFKYALRVVTAGSFVLPPIQASCMYDAGYASLHGGEGGHRVEVGR